MRRPRKASRPPITGRPAEEAQGGSFPHEADVTSRPLLLWRAEQSKPNSGLLKQLKNLKPFANQEEATSPLLASLGADQSSLPLPEVACESMQEARQAALSRRSEDIVEPPEEADMTRRLIRHRTMHCLAEQGSIGLIAEQPCMGGTKTDAVPEKSHVDEAVAATDERPEANEEAEETAGVVMELDGMNETNADVLLQAEIAVLSEAEPTDVNPEAEPAEAIVEPPTPSLGDFKPPVRRPLDSSIFLGQKDDSEANEVDEVDEGPEVPGPSRSNSEPEEDTAEPTVEPTRGSMANEEQQMDLYNVQRANSEPEPRARSQSSCKDITQRCLSNRWQKIRPGFCRYVRVYRMKVEELSRRSISVERLLHFYHEVVIKTFNMDPNALTEDVVQDIIIPMTEEDEVSWVDYLEKNTEYVDTTPVVLTSAKSRPFFTAGAEASDVEPTTHVVHAWKMRFVDLLAAILQDASHGKTRKLGESYEEACRIYAKVLHKPYWICAFCINQHLSICHEPRFKCRCSSPKYDEATPQCEFDKFSAVAQVLHQRGGGMLLALERDLQALSRAWCVDEVHYALATGMAIKPSFSTLPGFCSLREFVCEVTRCQARPSDKERILNKIQIGTGIPAFNDRVTTFLQTEARLLMDAARNRSRSISVTRRRRSGE